MTTAEMLMALVLAVVMIIVGYQIYFFPQKSLIVRARSPVTIADRRIPFQPKWVWIYSGLYYPFWVSPILVVSSFSEFLNICASYATLLVAQMSISYVYPVKTPADWRQYDRNNSLSEQFLGFVQSIDKGGNAFPSMHVAVVVLTALHITRIVGSGHYPDIHIVWVIPAFVALSTLYTKQHLIVDVPAGAVLALAVYLAHASFV